MDFFTSTHCEKWIFTEAQIEERRRAANEAGVSGVRALRQDNDLPLDGLEPLTVSDELKLLRFRLDQTLRICAAFQPAPLPKKVASTAITFIQRFYLNRSCMLHDLELVTVVCIYLAAKVCERYVNASRLESMIKVKAKDILALETEVLDALSFDLVVYHPYRNIDALMEEISAAAKGDADPELAKLARGQHWAQNVHKLAYSFADALMKSDAPLQMTPGQQALGALAHALTKYGLPRASVVERYARLATEIAQPSAEVAGSIKEHIEGIMKQADDMAAAGFKTCTKEEAAALDLALRRFNPSLDKTSKLGKQLRSLGKKRKRVVDDDDD